MKTIIEQHELYDGIIHLDYWPASHKYVINGDKKIGVTTITGVINKPALMTWPMEEALAYLKENPNDLEGASKAYLKKQLRGTDAGTAGHDWLEGYLRAVKTKAELPSILEKKDLLTVLNTEDEHIRVSDHNNMVDSIEMFLNWMEDNDVKVIEVEKIIYSINHDYCGRFDAILDINGKVYIIDFKTSNPSRDFPKGIYPENFAQMGGYDIAYTEEFPHQHIDGHAVFNLSKKKPSLNIEYSDDRQLNRDFFLFCLGTKRGMMHHTNRLKYQDKKGGKNVHKEEGAK
jgi:hypothetical protein